MRNLGITSLGLGLVALDMAAAAFVSRQGPYAAHFARALPALAIAALIITRERARSSSEAPLFGLSLRPEGGWPRWLLIGAIALAGFVAAAAIGVAASGRSLGETLSAWRLPDRDYFLRSWIPWMVGFFPAHEELVYRYCLHAVLRARVASSGKRIAMGGLAFFLLHAAMGRVEFTNVVGGFLMSWAYERSRSLAVAWVFHAGGNLALGLVRFL